MLKQVQHDEYSDLRFPPQLAECLRSSHDPLWTFKLHSIFAAIGDNAMIFTPLVGFAAVAFAQALVAGDTPAEAEAVRLERFLAAVDAGELDTVGALLGRIMPWLEDPDFTDAASYVDRVADCSLSKVRPLSESNHLYRVDWDCEDGQFYQMIDPATDVPRFIVTGLNAENTPTLIPPPPLSIPRSGQ
ncbi:hypothetical protein [Erythrobacter sp. SG61-1L]|uniref:hypothetical protein n=1 Tax=Erythrobacter sp. SG61-1L TaxID=1603897 RepID=UPI000B28FEBD|nr:hypothetical protein [Erythrobacter sp. SG61-1L]